MTYQTVPTSVEQIDGAWITSLLRGTKTVEPAADVAVTGVERVGADVAFACRLYRLHLSGPAGTPAAVIVKLPIDGPDRAMLDAIGTYPREVLFYRDLAPEVPLHTPTIHLAAQSEHGSDFVIVMEDLAGCHQISQRSGFSIDQAGALVRELARFHAWSWGDDQLLDRYAGSFWPLTSEPGQLLQGQYGQLFRHVWHARRDVLTALLDAPALDIGDRFTQLQARLVAELGSPRCLTHGELRAENLFFDADERPVFVDFQTVQQESGVRELAYLLSTSVPVATLERQESTLLGLYVRELRANGVTGFSDDDAQRQYRLATAYNLIWPVMASVRYDTSTPAGRALLDDMIAKAGAAISRNDPATLLATD